LVNIPYMEHPSIYIYIMLYVIHSKSKFI
jgi:hypothetical protein